MGAHIYCIVASNLEAPGDVIGIGGARVEAARSDQVGVWYSEHDAIPTADVDAIRAHHAVVQTAMTAEHTPVPIRFGQWFPTPDAAFEQISANQAKWLEQLARFCGCVEFGLRIGGGTDAARDVRPPGESGTAYMAELARRHAAAQRRRTEGEAIAMRVQGALTGLLVDARVEFPAAGGLVSLAHLVARRQQALYHAAVDEIRRARTELTFQCSGPWPPYSFVA